MPDTAALPRAGPSTILRQGYGRSPSPVNRGGKRCVKKTRPPGRGQAINPLPAKGPQGTGAVKGAAGAASRFHP